MYIVHNTTLLRPVVLYKAKVWMLNRAEKNWSAIFERQVLRKLSGPVWASNFETRREMKSKIESQTWHFIPNQISLQWQKVTNLDMRDICCICRNLFLRHTQHVSPQFCVRKNFNASTYVQNKPGRLLTTWLKKVSLTWLEEIRRPQELYDGSQKLREM